MKASDQIGCAWELSAAPAPASLALHEDLDVEVAIIGAGYTGLSAALQLGKAGVNIAVIEARDIGWGASGRNGGHVVPLLRLDPQSVLEKLGEEKGRRLILAVKDSAAKVFGLIRKHNLNCDAEQVGWLQPGHAPLQLEHIRHRCQQWQDFGAQMDFLDRSKMSSLTGTDVYGGGLIAYDGGHINPLSYVRELARVAIASGVRIFTRSPALALTRSGDDWIVKTPTANIRSRRIILATAAYTDDLWPGLRQSIFPFHLYSVATQPLPEEVRKVVLPGRQPMTDSRNDARVFHYDRDGRLFVGGTFIVPLAWRRRLPGIAAGIISSTFPVIDSPVFERAHSWRGTIGMTTDVLPHLHILAPGVYTWLGCNARGIALSTMMGQTLADLATDTALESLPLRPSTLAPVRFHALLSKMTAFSLAYYRCRDRLAC